MRQLEVELSNLSIAEDGGIDSSRTECNDEASYSSDGDRLTPSPEPEEPALCLQIETPTPVTELPFNFEVIRNGTIQGFPQLADGKGFKYSLKRTAKTTWTWSCTHRDHKRGSKPCQATIKQSVVFRSEVTVDQLVEDDAVLPSKRKERVRELNGLLARMIVPKQTDFTFHGHDSEFDHNHQERIGIETQVKIARDAKVLARKNPFDPALEIVEKAMKPFPNNLSEGHYPKQKQLARCLNREKEAAFPKLDTTDQRYVIDFSCVKGA
jgi:hypothetical protein